MRIISIKNLAGIFAENKDIARSIRVNDLMPTLEEKKQIILDFSGVDGATQSFVHALISEAFRKYGDETLELVQFKNCNETVKQIISMVTEYMQEAE